MIYNSNFDDSDFKKVNHREFNRTIDDPCAIQQRAEDNGKKLKFMTTNHIDLLEAREKLNFYGMTVRDQLFVPADNMDGDSFLRYGKTGGIMTNPNIKNEFGQLPFPTLPAKYQTAHGNFEVEDILRTPLVETNKNSCNPRDTEYYKRTFGLFDDKVGIETPNALKSVETDGFGPRGGISTRFLKQKK
jgi:hypothetical protein